MGLTRVDCNLFRSSTEAGTQSTYVAFNPVGEPGHLVAAGALPARNGIGGQVACRLAMEHFVEAVLNVHQRRKARSQADDDGATLSMLEEAFKLTNQAVYQFGHRLAAGGRLAARVLGLTIRGQEIAAARAGGGSIYLWRGGELFPFFEESSTQDSSREQMLGTQSKLSVDFAAVTLRQSDLVLVFPEPLTPSLEVRLRQYLFRLDRFNPDNISLLCKLLFPPATPIHFAMLLSIGPDSIYLSRSRCAA